jgi:hypothetical protein
VTTEFQNAQLLCTKKPRAEALSKKSLLVRTGEPHRTNFEVNGIFCPTIPFAKEAPEAAQLN